ncbi:MAG: ATP-binding protein [Thermoanaerobaculia bacterium]
MPTFTRFVERPLMALLPEQDRPALVRYGCAALAVVVATLVRWLLHESLGGNVPFLLYFPAIIVAGWLGGLGPALLATALSGFGAEYFFMEPTLSFRLATRGEVLRLSLFMGVGVFISLLIEELHRSRWRVQATALEQIRHQEELLRNRQESEERFRIAWREAEAASRSKDEFLATLSHELRTPLNAILGWTQILELTPDDGEKRARGLQAIHRNAKAQAQLIDDLLDLSRIVSGQMRLDVRTIDLLAVIDGAVEAVRPAAEARSIRLHRVLDPQAGPIAGDADRLRQVAWNLLSNAVKFTPKGGRVEVRLERVNSHVEIIVADSGIGISPEFLPHVFDRFRQFDSSASRTHGGLGLGLAIVRHLVELHGGTVEVRSPGLGQGSTFVVALPLSIARLDAPETRVHPRAVEEAAACRDDPALNLRGIRVLIVDDEPDARETLMEILEHCEAEVLAVSSAGEAIRELERFRPHVLLSDIGMPGEDGYALIRRVRDLPPERGGRVPAAALTAFARGEDRRRALLAGFQMHVPKPVEVNELATVVATLARGTAPDANNSGVSAARPPSPPG